MRCPARDIERPGAAIDEGLARELVPRVGEGARRREEGAVVTQKQERVPNRTPPGANAPTPKTGVSCSKSAGRPASVTPIMPSTASTKHAVNTIGASHARERDAATTHARRRGSGAA